jgi:hypothetical protein
MRFDHLVVAVCDLDTAMVRSQKLCFYVEAGGNQPDFGSRDTIIRFGLEFAEV